MAVPVESSKIGVLSVAYLVGFMFRFLSQALVSQRHNAGVIHDRAVERGR
jgi:hypothetical protein